MNWYRQCKTNTLSEMGVSFLMRKTFALLLASSIGMSSLTLEVSAQMLDSASAKPVRGQVSISRDVNIVHSTDKVSLNMRDASMRDVLNMLAEQGKFNLIMDQSVDGTLTVDIKNVSINKALEYIFTVADLSYTKDGNTLIVATKATADAKNLNAKTFKAIPVQYKDATNIAAQLNNTLFKVSRPGGSTTAVAASDPDSNSLLIIGTDSDLKLVADALRELDVPRNRKVYQITHSTPSYVAQVLAANFFMSNTSSTAGGTAGGTTGANNTTGNSNANGNNGNNSGGNGNSGGNSTGGSNTGGGGTTGGNNTANGSGGTSGNNGGSTGSGNNGASLNTFTTGGVTFIPEPIASTLTVLATDEQLALIDSLIDQADVRRPQAVIEVALVELQNTDSKTLKPVLGTLNLGREMQLTLNKGGISTFLFNKANNDYSNSPTLNPNGLKQGSLLSSFSMSNSSGTIRNKVLANPTIIAMDGTSSTITITDQIPTITQTVTTTATGPVTATNITTQDAGVTLSITPQINNDGYIVLQLQPEVSQPAGTISTDTASTILISKRSLNISGARVKDGETLVIGGLVREGDRMDITRVPGLDKLPIVSAMFRSINNHNKDKTELVLMVTPHILKDEAATYFKNSETGRFPNPNQGQGGMQPVSLPKFIGPMEAPRISIPEESSAVPMATPSKVERHATKIQPVGKELVDQLLEPHTKQIPLVPMMSALDALKLPVTQNTGGHKPLPGLMEEIVKD